LPHPTTSTNRRRYMSPKLRASLVRSVLSASTALHVRPSRTLALCWCLVAWLRLLCHDWFCLGSYGFPSFPPHAAGQVRGVLAKSPLLVPNLRADGATPAAAAPAAAVTVSADASARDKERCSGGPDRKRRWRGERVAEGLAMCRSDASGLAREAAEEEEEIAAKKGRRGRGGPDEGRGDAGFMVTPAANRCSERGGRSAVSAHPPAGGVADWRGGIKPSEHTTPSCSMITKPTGPCSPPPPPTGGASA